MERENVNSSDIKSVGYDQESSVLEIEFNEGGVYQYLGVSEYIFESLMGASSHGRYFNDFIKGSYQYRKVS